MTDTLHRIDGVPEGCKRVEDKLRIVRDERDDFDPGQIALTRVAVDPLLDAAILKANQQLTVLPYKIGKSAALRQGNAVDRARLPAGRHAGGVERQGRQPLRPRSGAGLGPRRLRDRRAAVGGELGQPGAGGVVQVARAGAGRRLPRRLQGARRAERRRRHRPARRVHAQEAAHPARDLRRGLARRAGRGRARARSRTRSRRARCRCSTSAAWSCAPRSTDGALLYHVYGRQFPLDDRRVAVLEDLAQERRLRRARPALGPGADRLARVAARRARHRRARPRRPRRRLDPPPDPAHARLPPRARQPELRRRAPARPRRLAHHRPRPPALARSRPNLLETADRLSSAGNETTAAVTSPAPSPRPRPPRSPPAARPDRLRPPRPGAGIATQNATARKAGALAPSDLRPQAATPAGGDQL